MKVGIWRVGNWRVGNWWMGGERLARLLTRLRGKKTAEMFHPVPVRGEIRLLFKERIAGGIAGGIRAGGRVIGRGRHARRDNIR